MRKTLYLKFVLGYLIFGFFGFLVVATFVSSMTLEHLKREKADSLYKEATLIANTYASDLYSSNVSLEEVKKQLDALSTYLSSQIWIINPSGRIIMTTETPLDVKHESRVENFDSTITAPPPPVPFIRLVTFSAASRRKCSVYLRPSLPILKCRAMLSSISPWQIFGLPAKAC